MGRGLQNGEKIVGPKVLPSKQGTTFYTPALKGGNLLCPPPVWLKLQAQN